MIFPLTDTDLRQFNLDGYSLGDAGKCLNISAKEENIVKLSRQMMNVFAENIRDITIENLELSDIIKKFYCYFPAMILLGRYSGAELVQNFSVATGWMILLTIIGGLLWKMGLTWIS